MSAPELPHAIAIETEGAHLDEENLTDIDDLVSVCEGLEVFDEESDCVRLAHHTIQEYFEKAWPEHFPEAHRRLGSACTLYLSFDDFNDKPPATPFDYLNHLRSFLLYAYAAENWDYHAQKQYTKMESLVSTFLQGRFPLISSLQVLREDRQFPL